MRINKYLAQATGMSRRAADAAIAGGRVVVNGSEPSPGYDIQAADSVVLDTKIVTLDDQIQARYTTICFNKPVDCVVSRNGQGSQTIYDLLPRQYQRLKPVGRLDKDSSGLLLLTDDGDLANHLTHPRYHKRKVYEVCLDSPLAPLHRQMISDHGIQLEDGRSRLELERLHDGDERQWRVTMSEGRNRQIRRTFNALGYDIVRLHRTHFGEYALDNLEPGKHSLL